MLVLGIETSCDETAASVVKDGREVLSNIISSQVDIHKQYGGVVPEIASRHHIELIMPVIDDTLKKAKVELNDIDAISVTYGPGLVGALLVGLSAAKALAWATGKPLVGVNHIQGHIAANYISSPELEPEYVCLIVSGGHSHIVHVKDYDSFEVLGRTRDDAAGEAFDKVARAIGLGYPGGPKVDKAAKLGNPEAIAFPRVRFEKGCLDFSFSGLKTSVINYLHNAEQKQQEVNINDVAASFQMAVVDVLIENTFEAAKRLKLKHIAIAGGVAANSLLREKMQERAKKEGFTFTFPPLILCTDNAAMIAAAGYFEFIRGKESPLNLNAVPSLKLS